jgi:hypothetical protein
MIHGNKDRTGKYIALPKIFAWAHEKDNSHSTNKASTFLCLGSEKKLNH